MQRVVAVDSSGKVSGVGLVIYLFVLFLLLLGLVVVFFVLFFCYLIDWLYLLFLPLLYCILPSRLLYHYRFFF
jgi:hypothetical protein